MLKRTITGAVLVLIAAPLCYFSDTYFFVCAIAVLSAVGVYEMLGCIGVKKRKYISVPLIAIAGAFPILERYFSGRDNGTVEFLAVCFTIAFLLMMYLVMTPVFTLGATDISEASTAFVTSVYVMTGFVSLAILRDIKHGQYLFYIPLVAPMLCDIFAYLAGRAFGKHKLIPKISPNKTVEGSIGGTLACTLFCVLYGVVLNSNFEKMLPIWTFAVGGVVIAVISQLGDLAASAIKRKYDIKDYGKIFPGHGGVMDRFDSIVATVPIFTLLVAVFNYLNV